MLTCFSYIIIFNDQFPESFLTADQNKSVQKNGQIFVFIKHVRNGFLKLDGKFLNTDFFFSVPQGDAEHI